MQRVLHIHVVKALKRMARLPTSQPLEYGRLRIRTTATTATRHTLPTTRIIIVWNTGL